MRRVLVVDDDPVIQFLVGELLRAAAYDVRVVDDGDEGWAAIQEDPPELVVLDVMMPGLDGDEVLSRIRANPATADLPVLLMSALNSEEDVARGFAAGANDYVRKPFENDDLLARVAALLP
jgi:DNA-binding response OmpR family regulator